MLVIFKKPMRRYNISLHGVSIWCLDTLSIHTQLFYSHYTCQPDAFSALTLLVG